MNKKNLKLYILLAFFSGYFISDVIINNENGFVPNAKADVGGMDYYDLRRDRDFVKAVKYVVAENCHTHIGKNNPHVPKGYSTWHHCD
jgi:hypothetical protein